MSKTLTEQILDRHRSSGGYCPDHTLVHDLSGLLAFMGFEAMDLPGIGVEKAFVFTDHDLTGMSPSTAADQAYLRSCARRFGAVYAPPGSGICHSLYYHRFARPGLLLAGADSHTATAGAVGMLGVGMGGMDIAVAMSGDGVHFPSPKVVEVRLTGALRPGASAKDAALTLLGRLGVKGLLGAVAEYTGPGVEGLSVHQRATFCNMGTEAGATSSLFPSDSQTLAFLRQQGREGDYRPMAPEAGAVYDRTISLELGEVEPAAACPGQPDRVRPVRELSGVRPVQVVIGSCTNGSYFDLARAAAVLQGRRVAVDTLLACGSRDVLRQLERYGWLRVYLEAGVRLLDCGCGPCMGIGQMPRPGAVVLRSTNRNYPGRSGTADAEMYLCGAETATASAVTGHLTAMEALLDPAALAGVGLEPPLPPEDLFQVYHPTDVPLERGSSIKPLPVKAPPGADIAGPVSLKLGDGVSTDDIVPPRAEVLTLRPNIPALSAHLFASLDPDFPRRAKAMGTSFLVAGENYAQGSSREHAAIGCMYLGVEAVLACSIHRIHRANLINFGILPLLFADSADRDQIEAGDELCLPSVRAQLDQGPLVRIENRSHRRTIWARAELTARERAVWEAGGLVPYVSQRRKGGAAG